MSVNVSKFAKKKENSSSVTVNNNSRGYSNTNNNYTASQLDRMLWNIHDTGQDITGSLEIPQLSVNGTITAGGRITGRGGLTIFGDSYMNGDVRITGDLNVDHKIKADEIEAVRGNITYLNSYQGNITNIISTNITTDNLNVTKSAHFAELIIDKIKAAGGSVILSCADGFKLETENDIIALEDGYWMLAWNAEDDRNETINMWERGDQALCMNFNDADLGIQTDVNSVYYWGVVYDAGTFDPAEHSYIDFNDHDTLTSTSAQLKRAKKYSDGTDVKFTDKKHWIIVRQADNSDGPILITDANGNEEDCYEGDISYVKPGHEIVMLGHRPSGANDDEKRSNAIYLAAYDKGIEKELVAPFIAQYRGITDFELSSHKFTWFAGGNSAINGYANQFVGNFITYSGKNLDDITNNSVYYITSSLAFLPVTSSWRMYDASGNTSGDTAQTASMISGKYIFLDAKYTVGNTATRYIWQDANGQDYMNDLGQSFYPYVIKITHGYNGTNNNLYIDKRNTSGTAYININNELVINLTGFAAIYHGGSYNDSTGKWDSYGNLDTLEFSICRKEQSENSFIYTELCKYNLPIIPEAGGQPGADGDDGKDGEIYKLRALNEVAQIDVAGNFSVYLRYRVDHIIGDTITSVTNNDTYNIRFRTNIQQSDSNIQILTFNNGIYNYDADGDPGYYDDHVFGSENDRLLKYKYITVELYKTITSGGTTTYEVIDTHVIPVTLLAGAMFSITDVITSRVTDSEENITYLQSEVDGFDGRITTSYNMASEALQTANGFENRVSKVETDLVTYSSYFDDISYISEIREDNSYLLQYANSINSYVGEQVTRFENGYSYITSNYSTIDQTAQQISLYVNSYGVSQDQLRRTGIDITSYNITLNGDTVINGQLDLNSGEGFNLNNEDGSLGAKIHGGEIPDYDDWISLTTSDLAKKVERDETFTNIGTSRTFTVDFSGDDKIDLGLKYSGDNFIFKEIAFRTFVILTACTVTAKLYNGTTLVKTINGTLSADVYDRWKYTLNDTYNITTNGNYYMTLTFTCTGTPNFETCYVKGLVYLDTQINNLTEIGSNGIGQRNDTENYNYFSTDITEARHGGGGLSVKDNETLYLGFNKTSGGLANYSWRSINSINSTLVNSNYTCTKNDCLLIVSPPSGTNSITINLPSGGYNGQLLYIRRLTGTNITLNGTMYDINNGSITTKNLFTTIVLSNVNIIPYFATLVYDGSRWIILDISGYYFTNIQ